MYTSIVCATVYVCSRDGAVSLYQASKIMYCINTNSISLSWSNSNNDKGMAVPYALVFLHIMKLIYLPVSQIMHCTIVRTPLVLPLVIEDASLVSGCPPQSISSLCSVWEQCKYKGLLNGKVNERFFLVDMEITYIPAYPPSPPLTLPHPPGGQLHLP